MIFYSEIGKIQSLKKNVDYMFLMCILAPKGSFQSYFSALCHLYQYFTMPFKYHSLFKTQSCFTVFILLINLLYSSFSLQGCIYAKIRKEDMLFDLTIFLFPY